MKNLEIFEYSGEGYNPTMNFDTWRVAIANFGEQFDFSETVMQPGKIYNVKKGTYHALLMERDAKVLIVENHNTGRENTEYYYFR